MPDQAVIHGKTYEVNDVLIPWLGRKKSAEEEMKNYLAQVRVNRMFAAGKQHLNLNKRDGRVVEVTHRHGVELVTSNFLDQYILTVVGRLASNDYKPNFVTSWEDAMGEDIAQMVNAGFSWGWDNEWHGDEAVLTIIRTLAIDGIIGVRARFDRRYGPVIGDVPYRDGTPIVDKDEAVKYIADKAGKGETAEILPLREGKVRWEFYPIENLLPPPGYEHPREFPWHIIKRPVPVLDLKHRYGKLAESVVEDNIENLASLTAGFKDNQTTTRLDGMTFLYTGYEEPNAEHKEGRTVVFTEHALLDVRDSLPLSDHPLGPRTGLHYFRWQVLPGRFVGKAFIENGIGPQKIYNKRHTQINAILDRNMPKVFMEEQSLARPKTGEPMEIIEVRPGSPLPKVEQGVPPGAWMTEDLEQQVKSVERALGIRGVTMGQAPQGVSAYSAMALLSENDALKLDPIGQDFGNVMDELCWDTMELMRRWPSDKKMQIVGETGRLEEFSFDSNKIPERYVVKRPHGGSLPRSQAAEIQKINDIWAASAGKLPLTWYIDSLNAGKPQAIPPAIGDADAHKAELENILILKNGVAPPVAPYDDDTRHVELHRAMQMEAQSRVDQGDEDAVAIVEAFESHIKEHEATAVANQAPQITPPMGGMMPQPSEPQPEPGGAPMGSADLGGVMGGF